MITVEHKHEFQEAIIHDDAAKIEQWIATFPPFLKTRFFIDKVLYTPLQLAYKHKSMNAFRTLLKLGVPITADDLVDSCCDGCRAYFDMLMEYNPDVNARTADQYFALDQAAITRDPHMTQQLIQHGAHINMQNKRGMTALHRAVENCNFLVIPILLQADIDTTIVDCHGLTALNIAEESDIREIIKMFDEDLERRKLDKKQKIKKMAADSITIKEDIMPPGVTINPARRQMKL